MRLAEPSAHIKRSANGGLPWLFTQHWLTLQGNTRGKKATKVILNFLDTITKAKRPPEAIYPRGQAERLHPSLRLKPAPAATQPPPATLEQHRQRAKSPYLVQKPVPCCWWELPGEKGRRCCWLSFLPAHPWGHGKATAWDTKHWQPAKAPRTSAYKGIRCISMKEVK